MPEVKRFRTLGQMRHKEPSSPPPEPEKTKVIRRVKPRKIRSDKKHRFTLRIAEKPWAKLRELSLNCGGSAKGASYNVICNKLIEHALANDEIVKKIISEYPAGSAVVMIRPWGWER